MPNAVWDLPIGPWRWLTSSRTIPHRQGDRVGVQAVRFVWRFCGEPLDALNVGVREIRRAFGD
jgi:hypothetical protein